MKLSDLFGIASVVLTGHQVVAAPCDPQTAGSGPVTIPDTVAAFHANPTYGTLAAAALTPSGYTWFSYLGIPNGLSGTYSAVHMPWTDYLGYRLLSSYSTSDCAKFCNAISQCNAFSIHYQRAPSLEPSWDSSSTCYNPSSTVQIMCTLWDRAIVKSDLEVNFGWPRGGFQVSITGSRGYNQN